jgi:putative FmdB family regulatory protein
MPFYEYKCETCGHEFEMLKKMSDPNPPCPCKADDAEAECGGETKKLISKSDFHLKGGGWYSDGY